MYTGTLIEDLIAVVERVQAQGRDAEMRKIRARTGVEDNEDFPLADAHMWAVPSGAAGGFWAA